MEELEGNSQISRFNESINNLIRLNNLYQQCNEYSSKGKLSQWKGALDAVWRELYSSAMKMDEKIKKVEDTWVKRKEKIDEKFKTVKNRDEAYKLLSEKEEFLRLLQDKVGKGTDWTDEDEDGFI